MMTPKIKKLKLLSATVIILLNSCLSYYPQVVDIPLIKEKRDIKINAGYFYVPFIEDDDIKIFNTMLNFLWTNANYPKIHFSPVCASMGVNFTLGNRKK